MFGSNALGVRKCGYVCNLIGMLRVRRAFGKSFTSVGFGMTLALNEDGVSRRVMIRRDDTAHNATGGDMNEKEEQGETDNGAK